MKIEIIAAGRIKNGPLMDLCAEYKKRMRWPVAIKEIDAKNTAAEHAAILKSINDQSYVFAMDERGQSLSSFSFTKRIETAAGRSPVQFIIGGADGLSDEIRKRADFILCFGAQTWPHMLARVMLLEQIYRAQQIHTGHPYHRE
jgi:23S rRNA (pseudouridine1915-N3)-methyltransferase